jgi:hypothetical protein
MKRRVLTLLAASVVSVSLHAQDAPANPTATLLVRTDLECNWSIDGEAKGVMKTGDRVRLTLELGEHLIEAVPASGGQRWERIVKLTDPTMRIFTISLSPIWTDPDTGLMWAKKDNRVDVTRPQAQDYCMNLALAGFRDWRLPTVAEMTSIFDPSVKAADWHAKGEVKITGYSWTSSPGTRLGTAWLFFFSDGRKEEYDLGASQNTRALCVRRPE